MRANSFWDWIRRWGLWILLGLAALSFLVIKLLPKPKSRKSILRSAEEGAKEEKDKAKKKLEDHREMMESRVTELKDIKAIEDEEERLKRLADFANREQS